jgi:hypothetical protein
MSHVRTPVTFALPLAAAPPLPSCTPSPLDRFPPRCEPAQLTPGQALYVQRLGAVVVLHVRVEQPRDSGWVCTVAALEQASSVLPVGGLYLTDDELSRAAEAVLGAPALPQSDILDYLDTWSARVAQHLDPSCAEVARKLSAQLSRTVDISQSTWRASMFQRPCLYYSGFRLVVERLRHAGYLAAATPDSPDQATITTPPLLWTRPCRRA